MAEEAQNGTCAASGVAAVAFAAVKPWIVVEAPKASEALAFYKAAFGAEEVNRENHPKRKAEQELPLVLSAELKIGNFAFVVSDLTDDESAPVKSAATVSVFCLETGDVDAALEKAVAAGGVAEGEVSEGGGSCCGGRVGKVKDPYGNLWVVCTASQKCETNVAA